MEGALCGHYDGLYGTYMEWGRYAGSTYSSRLSTRQAPNYFESEKDREIWLLPALNHSALRVQRIWRNYHSTKV